ncbi:MAG: hypothetical protein BECKG1743D_GA0114223_106066 [Candidatus Kentron sp. G]|nr:MAG: hypothetical protein BECKG1743F_GA0114225_105866 [Candidatus Kentron sp. G]VFN02664.1 MAG: hypothetical protein BECKG1743E_GA0114224_105306 [Candidatus Kentron sp. G]VFN04577.1 MAG: hypothetical protein BECKG1743D_GA0114223_106066 [Candidatus Kentron sp. G]
MNERTNPSDLRTAYVTVRMTPEERRWLDKAAKERGHSISSYARYQLTRLAGSEPKNKEEKAKT